jgi:hypothetical protein
MLFEVKYRFRAVLDIVIVNGTKIDNLIHNVDRLKKPLQVN